MVNEWERIDAKRINTAEYKEKSAVKERRKKYKRQRANKADAFVRKEGVQYKSQNSTVMVGNMCRVHQQQGKFERPKERENVENELRLKSQNKI